MGSSSVKSQDAVSHSAALFAEAQRYLAGGVSRNLLLRQPHPFYARSASGCRIVDVDGVERIDFANNMASLIHGHAHPAIIDAVKTQLSRGTAFTMATEVEIDFARHLVERSPYFAKIRFMNSGTEAVMAALKAARAHTGRPRFAKVEGTYHGAYDQAEVSQASAPGSWGRKQRPASVALAHGTPESILQDVVVIPHNHPRAALRVLDAHKDELACVLLDLMPHRAGLVPATPEFVRAIRDWTAAHDALLVFDEVITFRTEVGGMQDRYDVHPDLTAMGKIIGGGFPVGALTGRNETMSVFESKGAKPKVPQSGTFSANPVTMTAGLTAMQLYDAEAVARLNKLGHQARDLIDEAIRIADVPASVTGMGSCFRIHLKAEAPTDYRSTFTTKPEAMAMSRFITQLYSHGIMIAPTGAGFLSTPMGTPELEDLAEAVLKSLRAARAAQ